MDPDYRDAAQRHWEDAGLLLAHERLANADHLFGVAAECALKAVMLSLGMSMHEGKPVEKCHRVHIDLFWEEFLTFIGKRGSEKYMALLSSKSANPFADWDVGQRYAHHDLFDRSMVERHAEAARLTRRCLQESLLDGVCG